MGSKSRVLVTGGAGFIGSHTVDLLLEKGYEVRILDNLQPRVHPNGPPPWLPAAAEFVQGDVADKATMATALAGCELVVHLAAYQDYMPDFSTFMHTNAESAALLFELVVSDPKKYPVRKMVMASSQSVCGEGRYVCPVCSQGQLSPKAALQAASEPLIRISSKDLPSITPAPRSIEQLKAGDWEVRCGSCGTEMKPSYIDEETASPGTTYAISKYAIELLCDRLGRRYGIPTACMRYTYVQGPRNSFYNAYSGIARRFALRLMHGLAPTVYEDGGQLRDYINVSDVARANVLCLEKAEADFGVFNVGGGRPTTVLEFARLMLEAFDSKLEPEVVGDFRLGDTRHTISDISRLNALGWEPTVPVEQNVRQYVEWMRQQGATREFLDEAERLMREQGVIQRSRKAVLA